MLNIYFGAWSEEHWLQAEKIDLIYLITNSDRFIVTTKTLTLESLSSFRFYRGKRKGIYFPFACVSCPRHNRIFVGCTHCSRTTLFVPGLSIESVRPNICVFMMHSIRVLLHSRWLVPQELIERKDRVKIWKSDADRTKNNRSSPWYEYFEDALLTRFYMLRLLYFRELKGNNNEQALHYI